MANETTDPKKHSKSEKTNAKNLENTHIVNTIIAGIGADYDPSNPLLKPAAMTDFEQNSISRSQAVTTAYTAEQNIVGEQIAAFSPVSKQVTLIMKAVRGQSLSPEFVGHLQSTVYRLNGVKVGKNTPDTAANLPAAEHSVSRRSYAGILESLGLLSEQLTSNKDYKPNEPQFKSAAVAAWVANLQAVHNAALEAKVATRTARNARNSYIYNETDGIIPRMIAFKNYIATILDPSDPRMKQIKGLKFVDNTR